MTEHARPTVVVLVAVGLVGLATCSALAGFALSWVSSCCGSSDQSDATPILVGLLVAGATVVTSYGLWSGAMTRPVLLAITLVVPAVCVIAAFSAVDFQGLVPFAVIGWFLFRWFLSRRQVEEWIRA